MSSTPYPQLASLRLGIVSDAHHFAFGGGAVGPLAPLAAQFDQWASLFKDVVVCAPLLDGTAPPTHRPYERANIRFVGIRRAGGPRVRDKLQLVREVPSWIRAVRELARDVDTLHLRCPNNIGIIALLLTAASKKPRQAAYTGNWLGYAGEPATYRWQRWFLRNVFVGPVAVYGRWPDQPSHIVPSFSPAFSHAQWESEAPHIAARLRRLLESPARAIRIVSVGAATPNKNHETVVGALADLRGRGIDARLTICGDGPSLPALRELSTALGMASYVVFRGAVSHEEVLAELRCADFMALASHTEGFSKAVSEALCCGAIPILGDVGMHRQILGNDARGRVFPPNDPRALADAIASLAGSPGEAAEVVLAGRVYAEALTLGAWAQHLRSMLSTHWNPASGLVSKPGHA